MEKIKEWLYLERDNILSTLKLLVPLLLLLHVVNEMPRYLKNQKSGRYEIETSAVIESVKLIEGIKESETGGRVVNKAYEIEYVYRIDSSVYKGKSFVAREELTIEERVRASRLSKGDIVGIKVQSKDPTKSIVVLQK